MGSSDDRPCTPWAVHVVCYVLLGGLLVYVLVGRYVWPLVLQDGIGVESGRCQTLTAGELADEVDSKIDPNVATWSDLAAYLPGVGEVTAKKIVAFRTDRQADSTADSADSAGPGSSVVFSCPEDLQAVPGIGPKTVARITPYLIFGGSPTSHSTD